MTAAPSNSSLPRGITEADVIDLVDGVLPRPREAEVLAALKAHPALGLLAKQLRADRAMLTELPEVRAPRGLAEGVEARLQAAVLRDLAAQSEEVASPIPISRVQVRRPHPLRIFLESPWSRRLAAAASIALLAGLGAFALRGLFNAPAPKNVAIHPTAPTPSSNDLPATTPQPTITVAAGIPEQREPVPPMSVVATTPPANNEPTPATLARLAAEGRLAITIRAVASTTAVKRLDALAKGRDTGWHAIPLDAPAQYVALLTPQAEPPSPIRTPGTPDPIAIAGDSAHATTPPAALHTGSTALPAPRAVVRGLYTVELTPGEQPLSALLRSITDTLADDGHVSYRVLPQPIAAPVSLDPDAVLWWTSPTGKWSKRGQIPVVVEGLE